MNEKRMFVTGGAGFIGSHLVDRLVQDGCEVTVYDNLSSGKMDNIAHHLGQNGFTFIEADILDIGTLKDAMAGHDLIWHLGANTDIPGGNKVTDLDLRNCTLATHNVLEAMRQTTVKKIVFTSTSVVYGEIEEMPTSEKAGPLLPISLYGAGKLACEGMISAYCHLFDLQAWIFRFGNVIGARMGHGVVFDFLRKLERNSEELEILGDGNQEKPYFLVDDCLEGMLCALQNSDKQFDVFNLSSPTTISVTEVARIVVEEMGLRDVAFKYTGGRRGWPGDVPVVQFNVDKMRRMGWEVNHTSEEAVRIAAERLIAEGGSRLVEKTC